MIAFMFGWSLQKNNIYKQKNNKEQPIHKCYIIYYCRKVFHRLFDLFLKPFAINNVTIPKRNRDVNKKDNSFMSLSTNCGSMNIIPNHAAAIFTKNSDNISNQILSRLNIALAYCI